MIRNPEGSLSNYEKKILKGLLSQGGRNQDIQALINLGRKAMIISARNTEVKQDPSIAPAHDDEIEFFLIRKKSYDPQTGLNLYDDERFEAVRENLTVT